MNPAGASIALPSRRGLLIRTVVSLAVAAVIVFGFVLPAEYQIDVTGFGKLTGLTRMGKGAPNTTAAHTYTTAFRTDKVELSLRSGEEYEYELKMKEGEALVYSWTSDEPYEFDFHGHGEGKTDDAVSYTSGSAAVSHGSIIAPTTGIYSWFWKNHSDKFNPIHLKMAGQYELIEDFGEPPPEEAPTPPKR